MLIISRIYFPIGVIGGEGAIFEDGVREQVCGCHRDDQAGIVERLLEATDDLIALAGRRIDGHQVVVVEVDTISADLRQQMDEVNGAQGFPHGTAEWVAADRADRPCKNASFSHFSG